MAAVFHISGTNATDKSCPKIIAKGKAIAFLTRLKNKGGSISGRAEGLAFNLWPKTVGYSHCLLLATCR